MQRREDIFHRDAHVVVRSICGSDPDFFARQERAQGWHATPEKAAPAAFGSSGGQGCYAGCGV